MSPTPGVRSSLATLSAVFAAMIVVVWVVGFGIHEFFAMRHAAERDAVYAPTEAVAAASPPEFIALQGQFHKRGYMTLGGATNSDGSRAAYLPMQPAGADPRETVHWIVKATERDVRSMPRLVHAHVRGESLPTLVREGFERQGIVVAADARVVDFVEMRAGRPVDRTPNDWQAFVFLAGGITAIIVVLWILVTLLIAWQTRGGRNTRGLQPGA